MPISIIRKMWYWSYDRGSWQYDVMCVAILAFIFLIPASVFNDPEARPPQKAGLTETFIPAEAVTDGSIEGFSTMVGGATIDRIEVMRADDGRVTGYTIWSRTAREAGN